MIQMPEKKGQNIYRPKGSDAMDYSEVEHLLMGQPKQIVD